MSQPRDIRILNTDDPLASVSNYYLKAFHCFAGIFSLLTLLLKLVSGMGLLTLIATVIDTLALYILRKYRESVYDESPVLKQEKNE